MKLEDMNLEQTRAYVKELREESKSLREQTKVYTDSLGQFDEPQQRGLIHMISVLGENPEQGAVLFRELADNIQGESSATIPDPEGEDSNVEPEEMTDLIAKAVTEAMEAKAARDAEAAAAAEKEEFDRQVASYDAQAEALGYTPNSPEAADLFFMANKLNTNDLGAAHAELEKFNEFRAAAEPESDPVKQGKKKKAKADEEEEETPEFPKSAGKGAGAPAPEAEALDFKDDKAVRSAVFEMLAAEPEGT